MDIQRKRIAYTGFNSFLLIDGELILAAYLQNVWDEFRFNHFSSQVPRETAEFLIQRGVIEDMTQESQDNSNESAADIQRVYRRGENFHAFYKELNEQLGSSWLINGWDDVPIEAPNG